MKITYIDYGKNPQKLQYSFIPNARTKTKLTVMMSSRINIGNTPVINDFPAITMYMDSLITEVKNGIATKFFSIYDVKVEDAKWLQDSEIEAIRNELKSLNTIKGTLKISEDQSFYDYHIDECENTSLVKEFSENLKKTLNSNKMMLPSEPVGPGAIWVVQNTEHSPAEIDYNITTLVKYSSKELSNIVLESTSILETTSEQLKNSATASSEITRFVGNSYQRNTIDLGTGEKEMISENTIEMSTKSFDSKYNEITLNTPTESIQKLFSKMEYVY